MSINNHNFHTFCQKNEFVTERQKIYRNTRTFFAVKTGNMALKWFLQRHRHQFFVFEKLKIDLRNLTGKFTFRARKKSRWEGKSWLTMIKRRIPWLFKIQDDKESVSPNFTMKRKKFNEKISKFPTKMSNIFIFLSQIWFFLEMVIDWFELNRIELNRTELNWNSNATAYNNQLFQKRPALTKPKPNQTTA